MGGSILSGLPPTAKMGLHSPPASLPQRCDSYMPDQGILSAGACMLCSFSIDLLSQKRVVREPENFTYVEGVQRLW